MHNESSFCNCLKKIQRSATSLVKTGKPQNFTLVFLENVILQLPLSKIYGIKITTVFASKF